MNIVLQPYLEELKRYAGTVRVPGLDVEPIPLEELFIEPQLEPWAAVSSNKHVGQQHEKQAGRIMQRGILERFSKSTETPDGQEAVEPVTKGPRERAFDTLTREPRLVIRGEPGQGKSTLLRYWAARFDPKHQGPLPLLVELGQKRDWIEGGANDFQWLCERVPAGLRSSLRGEAWSACCRILRSGEATLLLDGLDELSHKARQEVLRLIKGIKGNRIVLSSRPYAYRSEPLAGFKVYLLADLQLSQVELLAQEICRAIGPQPYFGVDGSLALAKVLLLARGRTEAMVRNPLLLSFMCVAALHREKQGTMRKFPTRLVPVIADCVQALVEWHRPEYKPDSEWPEDLMGNSVSRILGKLALRSFQDQSGVISEEAVDELTEVDKKHFKHLVSARFVERRNADYVFPLETFREYFAGRAVAKTPDPYAVVKRHLHKPEWQGVILYCAGSLDRKLAEPLDLWFPTCTWLFAKGIGPLVGIVAHIVSSHVPVAGKTIEEVGPQLRGPLEQWLARSRRSTEFFVTAIWKRHRRWGMGFYESILHRDLSLAGRCVGAAGDNCPDRLAVRVAGALARHTDEDTLADAGQNRAVRRRWMELYETRALRSVADEPQVREWLVKLSFSNKKGERYCAVIGMAGATSDPTVRDRLLALAQDRQEDWIVREKAVQALGAALAEPAVQENLIELMRDREAHVRETANRVLAGVLATTTGQQSLTGVLRDKRTGSDSMAAAVPAAVKLGPGARNRLLEQTHDVDPSVRKASAGILRGAVGDPEIQEALLALIKDVDSFAREKTLEALSTSATNAALGIAGRAAQGLFQEFIAKRLTKHVPGSSQETRLQKTPTEQPKSPGGTTPRP